MDKIVGVTGSTGMIGKKVVEVLIKKGYKVKEMGKGRLENEKDVKSFMNNCDGVIHLAAIMSLDYGWEKFYKVNVMGSKNIAKHANKKKIRMLMVSSIVVFKDADGAVRDEKWPKRDTSANYYIRSKIEADKEVNKTNKNVITVYPTVVFDKSILMPSKIMALLGNKNRYINIVEVGDMAKGIVEAFEKGEEGEGYILGGVNLKVGDYNNSYFRIPIWPFKLIENLSKYLPVSKMLVNISKTVGGNMNFSSDKAKSKFGYRPSWKLR